MMLCDEKTRQKILARLSDYRLEHTLGCERAAIMLANRFGGDPEKSAFAALLHDITKRLSKEQQLYLCEEYGIIPCDVEKIEWKMLHGKTAAAIAAREFGAPNDVAAAIACHTAGKAGMTLLDKILYLADYIEDTRDFEGVEPARELAKRDIDQALLYCYDSSLADLIGRGKLIHRDTIEARNELILNGTARA